MFSVIIPVHNKFPHLDRSINSVLNQNYQNFELILVDDASTDGSSEKLEKFNDSRIRLFKRDKPGRGGYAARNLGIKEAKYDWIAFLDADDEWDINLLSSVYQVLKANSKAELITSEWRKIAENKQGGVATKRLKELEYKEFSLVDYLLNPNLVCTDTVVVDKKLIDRAGGFPSKKKCKVGGDVDTWIRWLKKSNQSLHINTILAYYYKGTVNQATGGKPNTRFCAYDTLMDIYNSQSDPKLRRAIKSFVNRFIYHMLARQVRAEMSIDYAQINNMFINKYSILRIIKLHLLKLNILK